MMDLEQENELVEKAKKDMDAFGRLYDIYYSQISGYILRRTADIDVAQDITSDVFFKALKNIPKYNWRKTPFSAWLYRIANNEITNHYRHNDHEQTTTDSMLADYTTPEPSPESGLIEAEETLQRHEMFLRMYTMLEQLPLRYQEVISLRYFEKKKLSEVAQILGKREGTVKSLLHRGLEKLRILMEENGKLK